MKLSFITCILVISSLINLQAQPTAQVIALGAQGYNYMGQQGIIDQAQNMVMSGKLFMVDDLAHLALFDKNNVRQWSFHLDKKNTAAQKIIQTRDMNYVAIFSGALILKFDALGNILWYRNFTNVSGYEDLVEDETGDLFVVGTAGSKLLVTKLSPAGNPDWTNAYSHNPISDSHMGKSIQMTHDRQLIVCGLVSYTSAAYAKASALKLDKSGNIIWAHVFSCATRTLFIDKLIQSTSDYSFFGVGYNGGNNSTASFDGFSLKLDSAGNYVNNKSIGFTYYDTYYDVCEASDGGFVAVGLSKPDLVCGGNLFFTKFNQANDTLFNKGYGTSAGNGSFFFNIAPSPKGGYYAFGTGSLWSTINVPYDYTFLQTDAQLELPCNRYSQPFNQDTLTITQSSPIIKSSYSPVFTDNYIKTNDSMHAVDACSGQPLGGSNVEQLAISLQIIPNPSHNAVSIRSQGSQLTELSIYTLQGKPQYHAYPAAHQADILTATWPNGIYFVKAINAANQVFTQKLIIAH